MKPDAAFEEFHVDPHENGFGYVLRIYPYEPEPDGSCSSVNVKAACVETLDGETMQPEFRRSGARASSDTTPDFDAAVHDIEGMIRFDGCANLDLSVDHFCHGYAGAGGFRDLVVTVERAYAEAQRIMRAAPNFGWLDEAERG